MKVLQIITSLYTGGAEKLLVDSIPLYKEKGIEMDLLLLNGAKTPFFCELENKGTIIYSLTAGNIKTVYNPLFIFRIMPYLKKYDIVHVHLFPTLYWVALAKFLSFSKTKLIFTEHNTNNRRINKKLWRVSDNFIYRQYKAIVSITKEVDCVIKSNLSVSREKFKIINNGIVLSNFFKIQEKKKKIFTDKSKVTIIQVSSFREQKDQATVIKSLQYLPENIVLLLAGEGQNRVVCENLAQTLNLSHRVSFLGIRTDIPELLEVADIVVLSSHWEGFGLAIVEGMAAGKPVIASDVPGLRDVVSGAGLLFLAGDAKCLAKKINMLLSDSELYEKTAQACLERSKQYDINKMVEQYIELYKEVLI